MSARAYRPKPAVVTGRRIERADAVRLRGKTEARKKHDHLHQAEGLTWCWCNCPDCWQVYPTRYDGVRPTGRCICRQCPCYVLIGEM